MTHNTVLSVDESELEVGDFVREQDGCDDATEAGADDDDLCMRG